MPVIEIEVDERHKEMFEELKEEMGEDRVAAEYTNLIQNSIYQTRYGSQGEM